MSRDALNRRKRTASPLPSAGRLTLSEADLLLFEAIDRHGPLPSNYLYEFTRHLRRDRSYLQNRLTEFYNGDAGGPYLTRPPQQFATYSARYQHLVYDLTARGKVALAERKVLAKGGNGKGEPFVHRLMGSCVAASFELLAPTQGLRYISLAEILSRPSCGDASMEHSPPVMPLAGTAHAVIPDRLFGLHYPDIGYRFFAVECDRNTESIERRNLSQTALARKFAGYREALRTQAHLARWGIPNLHVLVVTTSETHAGNILDYLRRKIGEPCGNRFAVAVEPMFGADWRVPASLLVPLLKHPWRTPMGVRDIGSA